jgi:hypothetical protein
MVVDQCDNPVNKVGAARTDPAVAGIASRASGPGRRNVHGRHR